MPRTNILILLSIFVASVGRSDDSVNVFVLAGQSNMQGHGKVQSEEKANGGKGSLDWLAKNSTDGSRLASVIGEEGNWVSRSDVQILYMDRHGDLAPGFGVRDGFIGPELGFGLAVGDAMNEPVLLIKIAWGGKSLGVDFRPPSAGGETGVYYKEMLRLTREGLRQAVDLFPQYRGRDLKLSGFAWHQGWNDRVNQSLNDEYEVNMAHFIRDVRKDLQLPSLPFVVAETGMSGWEERHPRALSLMKAQAAVAKQPAFEGNVAFVGTRDFYRPKQESPSGQSYHWNSNAETYFLIGEAMGIAMLGLIQDDSSKN